MHPATVCFAVLGRTALVGRLVQSLENRAVTTFNPTRTVGGRQGGYTDMSETTLDSAENADYSGFFNKVRKFAVVEGGTTFAIRTPDGNVTSFGEGTPVFTVTVSDERAIRVLASLDEGNIANAYVKGWFDVEGDFTRFYDLRTQLTDKHFMQWAWRFIAPAVLGQVRMNKSAISHHYDRDASFYLSFLDPQTRCYTQGIYEHADEPVEVAMRRKFEFCIDACKLQAGSRVLEIGPGWGAFSAHAARQGIEVTGLTISEASLAFMNKLAADENLPIKTSFEDILTYDTDEQYDAIVIMGVMEHLPDYQRVLKQFQRFLVPGGHVFLDASANRTKYLHSSFITEHIYPSNHSFFVLHDFLEALADTPMHLRGVWDDRESYHHTFVDWAKRFDSNKEFITERFGGEDFRRFRLYLWGSAHCFLHDTLQCYRLVLQKP